MKKGSPTYLFLKLIHTYLGCGKVHILGYVKMSIADARHQLPIQGTPRNQLLPDEEGYGVRRKIFTHYNDRIP